MWGSLPSLPASSHIYKLRCLTGEKLTLGASDVGKVGLKLFLLHTEFLNTSKF